MIKAVFYDLDNTLYDERTYFYQAFEAIADYTADCFKINRSIILEELIRSFNEKGSLYPYLFNDVLKHLDISFEESFISQLVKIFHSLEPDIILYDDVLGVLKKLKLKKIKLGLISNGCAETQRRKVKSLNLESVFDLLFFPDDYGKEKPDPYVYNLALDRLRISSKEAIYVGDNALVDFYGAKMIKMYTVRIRRGEFANLSVSSEKSAEYEIYNHQDIFKIINSIENKFTNNL